jgi:hypothetical protein
VGQDPTYREIEPNLFGSQASRKRWIRWNIWNRMPPLIRPFVYFAYRYFLRGGFLDGPRACAFHFLQALWYPMLIDIKYLELRDQSRRDSELAHLEGAKARTSPP